MANSAHRTSGNIKGLNEFSSYMKSKISVNQLKCPPPNMVDTNFQKKRKVILAEAQKLVDLCSVIILASLVRGNGLVCRLANA